VQGEAQRQADQRERHKDETGRLIPGQRQRVEDPFSTSLMSVSHGCATLSPLFVWLTEWPVCGLVLPAVQQRTWRTAVKNWQLWLTQIVRLKAQQSLRQVVLFISK
jgi:hypothetical protein